MIAPPPAVGGEGGCGPHRFIYPFESVDRTLSTQTARQRRQRRQRDSAHSAYQRIQECWASDGMGLWGYGAYRRPKSSLRDPKIR